jgi:diketogulonate reductase-like aldo/keto reductase
VEGALRVGYRMIDTSGDYGTQPGVGEAIRRSGLPREELYVGVWRQPFIRADQTLDAHISLLRRKLGETAARPRLLRTVRGVGVMMAPPS